MQAAEFRYVFWSPAQVYKGHMRLSVFENNVTWKYLFMLFDVTPASTFSVTGFGYASLPVQNTERMLLVEFGLIVCLTCKL